VGTKAKLAHLVEGSAVVKDKAKASVMLTAKHRTVRNCHNVLNTAICSSSGAGVGKLWPAGRMRLTRVYYAARRHVHVRKIFEVLFRIFDSNLWILNQFCGSRIDYIRLIDFN